ncbi:hypothetical protein [Spirulina major]|uniref:hypothetical protein n=1 Tax=Spirulina major TaxID=270636 RepID=UPI000934C95C|nr:hypothetical protein [Spirulina major]
MTFPLLPLVLLLVALGNIWLHRRITHDVYQVLTAVCAAVCLIWGFAIAHWSIHLLCLVLLYRCSDRIFKTRSI